MKSLLLLQAALGDLLHDLLIAIDDIVAFRGLGV
jgi:hypothetical protein